MARNLSFDQGIYDQSRLPCWGASELTQKPLFLIEGHASRNITPGLWLSADAYYSVGGETSIDGVSQRDAADTLRLGTGMGLRIWAGVM